MSDHPTERLSAYMDEELEKEERLEVERHLAACASCRALLSELQELQAQVAQYYVQAEAPDTLELNIMEALDNKETAKNSAASTVTKPSTVVVPAAGFLVLAFLIYHYGAVWLKLFTVLFKFTITAAYVFSHLASSIPAVWISASITAVGLMLISGLSLKRILRSSVQ